MSGHLMGERTLDGHRGRTMGGFVRTALVADALDALGLRGQCLGADIVPINSGSTIFGTAHPVQVEEIDHLPDRPYVGLLASLDAVSPGDVVVMATGRSDRAAMWGELVSTACKAAGSVGALTDGVVRDVDLVAALSFPVFGRGSRPYDCHGRLEVMGFGETVDIDGVAIAPGDLVIGDADGVIVIAADVSEEVIRLATEKGTAENRARDAMAQGMKPSEAYARYGVL